MKACRNLVNKEDALSIRKQCEILSVNRSSIYYAPVGESEENLEIMRKIDEHYLDHPTEGVLRVRDFLFALGFVVNHKRVRRLLRLMGLMAIYPKRNLSKLGLNKYIRPYFLKGLKIGLANLFETKSWQVHCIILMNESAPKTPKPDFDGLQVTENQGLFLSTFSKKDFSEQTHEYNV